MINRSPLLDNSTLQDFPFFRATLYKLAIVLLSVLTFTIRYFSVQMLGFFRFCPSGDKLPQRIGRNQHTYPYPKVGKFPAFDEVVYRSA